MMHTTWDKSVWNNFLEDDPAWAEFLFTRSDSPQLTAAEGRRLKYLKQSEFKKPYLHEDYEEMEYEWPGPIPGIWPGIIDLFMPGFPDFPFMSPEGEGPINTLPGYNICDVECEGVTSGADVEENRVDGGCCYCPGDTVELQVTGTLPIVGAVSSIPQGETVDVTGGIGTNTATISVKVPEGRSGTIIIEVSLLQPNGNTCDSNFNIRPCEEDECCPECDLVFDGTLSQDTVIAPGSANLVITGGTPPFTWELSAEDSANWSMAATQTTVRTNSVNAAAGACGSATIKVKDSCNCEAVWSVRNPAVGTWVGVGPICLLQGATDGDIIWGLTYLLWQRDSLFYKTLGKYQQRHVWRWCFWIFGSCDANRICANAYANFCNPPYPGRFGNGCCDCQSGFKCLQPSGWDPGFFDGPGTNLSSTQGCGESYGGCTPPTVGQLQCSKGMAPGESDLLDVYLWEWKCP